MIFGCCSGLLTQAGCCDPRSWFSLEYHYMQRPCFCHEQVFDCFLPIFSGWQLDQRVYTYNAKWLKMLEVAGQ